jgi:hypothetical protein
MTLSSWADGFNVSKLLELAPDFTVVYDLIRVTQGDEQSSLQLLYTHGYGLSTRVEFFHT